MSKSNPPLFSGVHVHGGQAQEYSTDITLRDLFAAAALIGNLAMEPSRADYEIHAEDAYSQADAMLAERERRMGGGD